ncbi:MAG: lytic transglycosylase domain-containing protein [Candidatus Eremiobacteraeota bacterium]|nr:lytic transglycosylase domain-containing protein [Candidatus Eremiobacteraeota bacterium]
MKRVFYFLTLLLWTCTAPAPQGPHLRATLPRMARALNIALSWPFPPHVDALAGAVLLRDGGAVREPELAISRAVLRTNPRIAQTAALLLAIETSRAARACDLPPELLAATLLQESAYDVEALSSAGAVGIAQFMPETAAAVGIDPYDPFDAIAAAGDLLGRYVAAYRGTYDDPYAAALAAYNAGPLAVKRYHGVPPYPETQEYLALIFDRWARIASYERAGGR